jgi:hypothetical protein
VKEKSKKRYECEKSANSATKKCRVIEKALEHPEEWKIEAACAKKARAMGVPQQVWQASASTITRFDHAVPPTRFLLLEVAHQIWEVLKEDDGTRSSVLAGAFPPLS